MICLQYVSPKFCCTYLEREVNNFNHVKLFATPWTVAHQAPLCIRFSRQEYWSGLPCLSPDSGVKLGSPALRADSLPSEPPGKPLRLGICHQFWKILSQYFFKYGICQFPFFMSPCLRHSLLLPIFKFNLF